MPGPANRLMSVQKLTALWAFAECGLGGMMHALRLPFTGLLAGGFAVIVLSLIAWYSRNNVRMILASTFIVLLIKAMLSPQTPLPAYFAVGFQGLLAALLFRVIPNHRLAAFLLCLLALVESALQKLIVVSLFYGQDIWKAVDELFKKVSQEFGIPAGGGASAWLIGGYLALHTFFGLLIGWWAGKLPGYVKQAKLQLLPDTGNRYEIPSYNKGRFFKPLAFLLTAAFISWLLYSGNPAWMKEASLLLFRVLVIALAFMLAGRVLRYFLLKRSAGYTGRLEPVLAELPRIRGHVYAAYQSSRIYRGWQRFPGFVITLIVLSLEEHPDH